MSASAAPPCVATPRTLLDVRPQRQVSESTEDWRRTAMGTPTGSDESALVIGRNTDGRCSRKGCRAVPAMHDARRLSVLRERRWSRSLRGVVSSLRQRPRRGLRCNSRESSCGIGNCPNFTSSSGRGPSSPKSTAMRCGECRPAGAEHVCDVVVAEVRPTPMMDAAAPLWSPPHHINRGSTGGTPYRRL